MLARLLGGMRADASPAHGFNRLLHCTDYYAAPARECGRRCMPCVAYSSTISWMHGARRQCVRIVRLVCTVRFMRGRLPGLPHLAEREGVRALLRPM